MRSFLCRRLRHWREGDIVFANDRFLPSYPGDDHSVPLAGEYSIYKPYWERAPGDLWRALPDKSVGSTAYAKEMYKRYKARASWSTSLQHELTALHGTTLGNLTFEAGRAIRLKTGNKGRVWRFRRPYYRDRFSREP